MQIEARTAPAQLAALSRELRAQGDKGLVKELNAGLRAATKPLTAAARQNYRERLPRRGGLNKRGTRARMTVQKKAGNAPSIAIVARGKGLDLRAVERGIIRHPVFQTLRRPDPPWVSQLVPSSSFSDAMTEGTPAAHREIEAAMRTVAAKIERSTRIGAGLGSGSR